MGIKKLVTFIAILIIVLVFSTSALASGNEVRFSGDIHIRENETKAGDVIAFGGSIVVDGTVNGNVVSFGGDVTVRGVVNGNVVVFGGSLDEISGSIIHGEIIEIASGGISLGDLSNLNINFSFNRTRWAITTLIISMVLSLLILVVMPNAIENMADYLPQKTGKVVLVGFLSLMAFPVLLIICLLTILLLVGLLFTPLLILTYILMGYIGNVAVSVFVGKRLSILINQENLPLAVKMLMGLVVLWGARNVPFVGGWISFALVFITLGVVIATGFGRVKANGVEKEVA